MPGRAPRSPWRERFRREPEREGRDRKSTRLNSSHANISYAVFCLKKKRIRHTLFSSGPRYFLTIASTGRPGVRAAPLDGKSTRLTYSHDHISYVVTVLTRTQWERI